MNTLVHGAKIDLTMKNDKDNGEGFLFLITVVIIGVVISIMAAMLLGYS